MADDRAVAPSHHPKVAIKVVLPRHERWSIGSGQTRIKHEMAFSSETSGEPELPVRRRPMVGQAMEDQERRYVDDGKARMMSCRIPIKHLQDD